MAKTIADVLRKPSLDKVGYSGLNESYGTIMEEPLRELRGAAGVSRYTDMWLSCPVIHAAIKAIMLTCNSVQWQVTSDQGEDDERLTYFEGMDIEAHVSEALSMMIYGWSYFWIQLKRDGGRLLIDKLAVRPQDSLVRWDFDKDGTLLGMVQSPPPDFQPVTVPLVQSVHYRTQVLKDNPEGWSYLRPAWLPFYYWKNLQTLEAISLERGGAGMPVITMPPGASTNISDSTSDAYNAAKQIRNIRLDEQSGFIEPDGWKLRFEAVGGDSTLAAFDNVIRRYESRMLMSTLTQFLMLGQNQVGTQALSNDQTDLFIMAVSTVADNVADTFTKQVIARLLAWNGKDPEGVSLTHTPVGDRTAEDVSLMLQKIGPLLTWTPTDETWLRQVADMPELDPAEMEAERERKAEMARAIASATARSKQEPEESEPDDKMGAEFYATNPDERRRRFERKMAKAMSELLERQKAQVIKMAQEAKRNGTKLV